MGKGREACQKLSQPSKYLRLLGFPTPNTLAIEGAKFKRAAFSLLRHECSGSLLPLWQVIRAGVVELVDTLDLGTVLTTYKPLIKSKLWTSDAALRGGTFLLRVLGG
ncbi:hypothetical protein RHODOSMS8_00833 [Rhodobiaceae bacterium]|nr:hypothetical protein RHODOSMS8_00833 [Rhodobiaceae bacterium]